MPDTSSSWNDIQRVAESARAHRATLQELLSSLRESGVLVAFSAGVDSTYLLYEAHQVLGERCVAATAVSPSLPNAERQRARDLAAAMGARHLEIETHEMDDPSYVRNLPDRCYFCKKELFTRLGPLAAELGLRTLAYGAMADDVGDHRPGARAAAEYEVRAPLQEAGLDKNEIRWLSREAGLPTWNLPAQACLASRFAYGQPIDIGWLRAIEEAEAFIHELGVHQVRVRHHGRLARIEVEPESIALLARPEVRDEVQRRLASLGYHHVCLDLAGYRSGSLNAGLTAQPTSTHEPH
jgi:uncharacterized protein